MKAALLFLAALGLASLDAAQPGLRIEAAPDSELRLSWPESAPEFGLEQTAVLGPGALWTPAQPVPTRADGRFVVRLTPAGESRFYRLRQGAGTRELVRVVSSSPARGEAGVAVTRETILRLDGALGETATLATTQFHAEFGGRRLLTRPELSLDRRTLTLFYLETLPADAVIEVTLDGAGLHDTTGQPLDPDADGQPGGTYSLAFETAGISGLPGTGVEGRVFASERNPDGSNRPLANVTITVDGAEEILRTTTDGAGFFRLQPSPAGRFFVHVDGRTASGSQWPGGAYYPFVGKAWEAVAGRTNNLANGTGEIFLPLIQGDALQTVSTVAETKVTFSPSVLAGNPALAGVEVNIPPNALFGENGARGGKVGIAPVPPDRLPEPLPPGLNLPLVITIQTDGPQNFDQPVPVRFPNLPDPVTGVKLGPGEKTVLWSFNHDTGRWESQGTATVTADGLFAVTDPGVGVRQPGWHGVAPGVAAAGPPRPPTPQECTGEDCPKCVQTIFCEVITKPGKHYALCALDCLGDVVDDMFGDDEGKPKPPRTAFETGLRCVGGPDLCPQKPEDSLSPERRDCMDKCRFPQSAQRVFVVPCEGFFDPCERPAHPALHGAAGADPVLDATAGLLPDRFEEQLRFWQVEGEFLTRLTGTPKIIDTAVTDIPKVTLFFDSLAVRVRPESPSGVHLSAQERADLIALPRPAQFGAADWTAMIDRLDSLQGASMPADVQAADAALTALVEELKRRGWKDRLDGLIHGHLRLSRALAPPHGSAGFPARAHYFFLKHHQTRFVQRGRLTAAGEFQGLVLSPGGFYTILYLDPVTGKAGGAFFQAGPAGASTAIPTAPLEALPGEEPDSDQDGLPDFSETVVGTLADQADSDGDGRSDGDEIAAGTNPLDGAPQSLGTLAASNTPGTAVDVVAWNDLAAVADTDAGVTLFDVSDPFAPVRLAQVDTPGRAQSVAASGTLLAVADDTEGVTLLDVSDPSAPGLRVRTKFTRQARAVAILEGRVVAGLASGELVVLDASGTELSRTAADNRAVQDVLAFGGFLYSLKVGLLEVFAFDGVTLTRAGSVEAAGNAGAGGRRWRLAGGGNRLYATHARGFHVFDLSSPLTPSLLRTLQSAQFGWKHIVPDGTGLGLAAVDANSTDDGAHDVSLYALGAEGTGTNLVVTLATPGLAGAATFHRGVALVADGANGLSVVNYRARELGSIPPAVQVGFRLRPGTQTLEKGSFFTAAATATDNERLSHVEFHLDDQRVALDGNFPFEAELPGPALAPGQTRFTLRARAFDTAGNSAWSDVLTLDPTEDGTAPRALTLRPGATERFALGETVPISVRFDEPVDPGALGTSFRLVNLGPDGVAGTPDDAIVAASIGNPEPAEFDLTPNAPLPLGAYQVRLGTGVTDPAGNPLATPLAWDFRVQPLGQFVGTTNVFWSTQAATTNNWAFAHLPTLDDVVRIATPDGAEVRVRTSALAYDLAVSTPLAFEPDTSLRLVRGATFDGPVTVGRNGAWRGGAVLFRGETRLLGALNLVDQDWTNEGHLVQESEASLAPRNTAGIRTTFRNTAGATWELIDGQLSVPSSAGPIDFVNEGRLVARGPGRTHFDPTRFFNLGSVEVLAGLLAIPTGDLNAGPAQHLGSYRVEAGATLEITGLWEFGRASRIHGAGTVRLGGSSSPFRGAYETDGTNEIAGTVTFAGSVRTTGPWFTRGGHAIFTGLTPRLGGLVVSEGALTASALPRLEVAELRVYRDLTVTTELEVHGPLRLDSSTTPGGGIGAARLLGNGRIHALGEVLFTGIVNSSGQGTVEIAGTARGEGRTIVQFGNNGHALAVAVGGTFDVSGIESLGARGGLTNDGTVLKTDAAVTELTRFLLNRGTVRLGGGTLRVFNGPFRQTDGTLTLAGGNLTVQASSGVVADTSASFLGGVLEGGGVLTCRSVTNRARLAPGSPNGGTGLLDFQVGTHPTLSIFQQAAEGVLALDVGGVLPGTDHDQLRVSGRALLGGTLAITPAPGFDPPTGQEFIVLTCSARQGTFAQVTGTALPGGKRLEVVYEAAAVKLRVGGP